MRHFHSLVGIALILGGIVAAGPAIAQQTAPEQPGGRRFAPPLPALRNTLPPAPVTRLTAPPLTVNRSTAPPLPPIVTFPLPSPCIIFDRSSCAGTANYVSFGDSLAVGLVAVRGYVPRYEQALERELGRPLSNRNFARSGLTSGELASELTHNPTVREALATAEVVTWNIGGADLLAARRLYYEGRCGGADNQDCLRATLAAFRQNWDQIVVVMREANAAAPKLIASMDLYNPFVRQDPAELQSYWRAANAHIVGSLSAAGIPLAPVSVAFNGPDGTRDPKATGFISLDGFHPNDRGHQVIAQALLSVTAPALIPQ